jgi:hypothetical protein
VSYYFQPHSIGLQIHRSYCSDGYYQSLVRRGDEVPFNGVLLLDSFGHENLEHRAKVMGDAILAANRFTRSTVVYRMFVTNPMNGTGDNHQQIMSNGQMVYSPAQAIAEHEPLRGKECFWAWNNEPNFADSIDTCMEVAERAVAANQKVAIGGWSVGGYEYADIPKLAPLLRFMARHPGRFLLRLHEYTRGSWTYNFDPYLHNPADWPLAVPASRQLHLMGRFRSIFQFCDLNGITRPHLFFDEVGFDKVWDVPEHVYGNITGIHSSSDYWRRLGYTDPHWYAGRQMQGAWKAIYQPYSKWIDGFCYFLACDHEANWRDWNVTFAPSFMDVTRKGFDRMYEVQATVPVKKQEPAPIGSYQLETTETHINLRDEFGNDIGDIKSGAAVSVGSMTTKNIQIGNTLWVCQAVQAVTTTGTKLGWVALTGTYALKAVMSPNEFIAQMREMVEAMTDLINRYEASLK